MDFADQIIKVMDYILSSPLLIGAACFFGAMFLIVMLLVIWQFVSVGRRRNRMADNFRSLR